MTKPSPTRCALALLAAVALAVPAAATAAPDRNFTVSAAKADAAWDGPSADGSYDPTGLVGGYSPDACSKESSNYCDETLINIDSGGPVTVDASIGAYSNPGADYDLYIYKSDASGSVAADADPINPSFDSGGDSGWPNSFEESAHVENVAPGYYLVVVAYYQTLGGSSYHGEFKVTGATPSGGGSTTEPTPSPTPDPSASPTPSASPSPSPSATPATPSSLPLKAASKLGSAKKAKKAKGLVFKATATAEIKNLQLALKPAAGGLAVGTAKVAVFKKGSAKIKLKTKKLKAGKYLLLAQGTVNGTQATTSQAVKVKK